MIHENIRKRRANRPTKRSKKNEVKVKRAAGYITKVVPPADNDGYIVVEAKGIDNFSSFTCALSDWYKHNKTIPKSGMDVLGINIFETIKGWRTTKLKDKGGSTNDESK